MARPRKLSPSDVKTRLQDLTGWKIVRGVLSKTYSFGEFPLAMKFVQAVGRAAERVQHHPDIDIRYTKITLRLVTHDAGGLTDFDFLFASAADGIFAK